MKSRREHKVALTPEAVAVLEAARELDGAGGDLIFPSSRGELLVKELLAVIDATGFKGKTTVHGLRSSFRQWAGENGEDDVEAELYLAHAVDTTKVERAYKRDARDMGAARELSSRWAEFVTGQGAAG